MRTYSEICDSLNKFSSIQDEFTKAIGELSVKCARQHSVLLRIQHLLEKGQIETAKGMVEKEINEY